jgi:plasmid stability protein
MATLTIRNVPQHVVKSLKSLARKQRRSMEQEVRELLEDHIGDRLSTMKQIEASWEKQTRRPTPREIDRWIAQGRK